MNPDEPVMYIVANSDLKELKKGKLAAQVAHSACKIIIKLDELIFDLSLSQEPWKWYGEWKKGSYVKLVKKAPESFLTEMIQKYHPYQKDRSIFLEYTLDEGRTQIESGSLTTIAFNPAPRDKLPQELLGLQLL